MSSAAPDPTAMGRHRAASATAASRATRTSSSADRNDTITLTASRWSEARRANSSVSRVSPLRSAARIDATSCSVSCLSAARRALSSASRDSLSRSAARTSASFASSSIGAAKVGCVFGGGVRGSPCARRSRRNFWKDLRSGARDLDDEGPARHEVPASRDTREAKAADSFGTQPITQSLAGHAIDVDTSAAAHAYGFVDTLDLHGDRPAREVVDSLDRRAAAARAGRCGSTSDGEEPSRRRSSGGTEGCVEPLRACEVPAGSHLASDVFPAAQSSCAWRWSLFRS